MALEVMSWEYMYNLIGDNIDSLNTSFDNAVSMFSRVNPFNLNGGGNSFVSSVSGIVTAIALQLCVLFFLLEFFKKSMDLHWVKWENVFLFLLKLIFAKVIIQNSMEIMEWIFTVFNDLALNVSDALNTGDAGFLNVRPKSADPERLDCCNLVFTPEELTYYKEDGGWFGFARVLKVIELMPSFWIAMGVMTVTGVVIFGRVFEVIVYTMVAPIPLSSFSNEEQRQIGIGFIKSYAAVCLQALMIIIMFAAFAALGGELANLQDSYASGSWGILLRVILLGMGIFKSGNWAKKLCGAM